MKSKYAGYMGKVMMVDLTTDEFFDNLERVKKMEKEMNAQLLFGHDFQQIQEWAAKGWIE